MNFIGTAVVQQEEDWFVATCLENGIASQGKTMKEAIGNLEEAISLYYEDEGCAANPPNQANPFFVTRVEVAIPA